MRFSTLVGPALAVLIGASWVAKTGAGVAVGFGETDLVVGGPHADEVTKTLTDANGIKHTANFFDVNLVNPWGVAESGGSPCS